MIEIALTQEAKDVAARALTVPELARTIEIRDNESYMRAGEMLTAVKGLLKEIDAAFDPICKRAHDAHKEALNQKKRAAEPLLEAERILKKGIADYQAELERRRMEEEARLREEARKREEEARLAAAIAAEKEGEKELAEQILEEPVAAPVVHVPPAAPKLAGVSARKVWKYRVVNEALIPRQYLTVDHAAIGRVVSALGGRATIPGIEVYEETVIAAGVRR